MNNKVDELEALAKELRRYGWRVPDPKHPLAEMENGRLEGLRRDLIPDMKQQELMVYLPAKDVRSFQNWDSGKVPTDPKGLIDGLSKAVSEYHGIDAKRARNIVLETLTTRQIEESAEAINQQAMQAIYSGFERYLLSSEQEMICHQLAREISYDRKDQILPQDAEDFAVYENLVKAWETFSNAKGQRSDEQLGYGISQLRKALKEYERLATN